MLRLLDTGAGPPDFNLALDEALWRAYEGTPVLRVYGWAPEALSLGRFQPADATLAAIPLPPGTPVVRRSTGGGAIFHHKGELTYCVVCAIGAGRVPADVAGSYEVLHGLVCAAFAAIGVRASARGGGTVGIDEGPALCFARRMPVDVLAGGRKIAGSAQRRRAGVLMQQGSILVERNPLVPTAGSLREAAGKPVERAALVAALAAAAAQVFGGPARQDTPTAAERALAEKIRASRYGNAAWTRDR